MIYLFVHAPVCSLSHSHRYLYVPIAKAINSGLALLLVFTFVALWHDLSLKLLTWGWAISLFVLPESIAAHALPASEVRVTACLSRMDPCLILCLSKKFPPILILDLCFPLSIPKSTATCPGTATSVHSEVWATYSS